VVDALQGAYQVLHRLANDQISRYWNDIQDGIAASVPPLVDDTGSALNQIMENLLLRKMQAWLLYDEQGTAEQPVAKIYALVVTQIWEEPGSLTRNLLVYALCGYASIPEELWKSGLEGLRAWARKKECKSIVAYTRVQRMVDVVNMLGGDTQTTFLQLEV
jgi:hypothetical protein